MSWDGMNYYKNDKKHDPIKKGLCECCDIDDTILYECENCNIFKCEKHHKINDSYLCLECHQKIDNCEDCEKYGLKQTLLNVYKCEDCHNFKCKDHYNSDIWEECLKNSTFLCLDCSKDTIKRGKCEFCGL